MATEKNVMILLEFGVSPFLGYRFYLMKRICTKSEKMGIKVSFQNVAVNLD